MDIHVAESRTVGLSQGNSTLRAFVDLAGVDCERIAVPGFNTQDTAAVHPARQYVDIAAVLEEEHAAAAFALFFCVACCEVHQRYIVAILEGEHIGIARLCADQMVLGRILSLNSSTLNSQIMHVADDQFRPVIAFLPEVILSARGAVIACRGKVIKLFIQNDGALAADGREEFVHCADVIGAVFRRGYQSRRICRPDVGEQAFIRTDRATVHCLQIIFSESVSFRINGKDPVAGIPGKDGVVLKGAAFYNRAVFCGIKHSAEESIIRYPVARKHYIAGITGCQHHLGKVVMDIGIDNPDIVRAVQPEEPSNRSFCRRGVVADFAAVKGHIPAAIQIDSSLRTVINGSIGN